MPNAPRPITDFMTNILKNRKLLSFSLVSMQTYQQASLTTPSCPCIDPRPCPRAALLPRSGGGCRAADTRGGSDMPEPPCGPSPGASLRQYLILSSRRPTPGGRPEAIAPRLPPARPARPRRQATPEMAAAAPGTAGAAVRGPPGPRPARGRGTRFPSRPRRPRGCGEGPWAGNYLRGGGRR